MHARIMHLQAAETLLMRQQRDEARSEARAAQAEAAEAIAFIKELNATKFQHGRQYRSRCGQFLAKRQQQNKPLTKARAALKEGQS